MRVAVGCDTDPGVLFPLNVGPALVDVLAALRLVGVGAAHEVPVGIILVQFKLNASWLIHFRQ